MNIENELINRSDGKCELCSSTSGLTVYEVPPVDVGSAEKNIYICETCQTQIENPDKVDANHWRCLNDSMWSQVPAVRVIAWRILNRIKSEGWAQDLLDMLYLEEEILVWAKATGEEESSEDEVIHLDSNGARLQGGDTVVLTKDLNVKGGGFTAKRGTAVRNISLVHDNAEQIEGKVNGLQIVILTQYVKKN